jgi:aldehyde:ferredoxin oxidoreductase
MADLVQSWTGNTFSVDDLVALGAGAMQDEQDFNERAGFSKVDDQLPRFFETDPLPPHNVAWDYTVEELQGAKA